MKDFKHTTENHVIVSFPPDSPAKNSIQRSFSNYLNNARFRYNLDVVFRFFSFLICIDTIIASPAKECLQNKR